MMVPTDEGSFLTWLVAALGCRKALEVGTFTGYSALSIAQVSMHLAGCIVEVSPHCQAVHIKVAHSAPALQALPADGHLICCEQDKRPLDLAREMWQQAGVLQKVRSVPPVFV